MKRLLYYLVASTTLLILGSYISLKRVFSRDAITEKSESPGIPKIIHQSWKTKNVSIMTRGYIKSKDKSESSGIPKIIHQSWKTNNVPIMTKGYIKSCMMLNKDYKYMFWDDAGIRQLIKRQFPHLLPIFNQNRGISSADLSRVIIVYTFGGVYIDLDVECLVPFETLLATSECILPQESWGHAIMDNRQGIPFISNFFIAAKPNNKFLKNIIDKFASSISLTDVVERFGPGLFTRVYHSQKDKHSPHLPNVLHPLMLSNGVNNEEKLKSKCSDREYMVKFAQKPWIVPSLHELMKFCEDREYNNTKNIQYTQHHFIHTWIFKDKFSKSKTFDVEDLAHEANITSVKPDNIT